MGLGILLGGALGRARFSCGSSIVGGLAKSSMLVCFITLGLLRVLVVSVGATYRGSAFSSPKSLGTLALQR